MAIYFVSTTGLDTNPGTQLSPFLTFNKGVSVLAPGDVLYLRGGTYSQTMNVSALTSGTVSARYTISGYSGETIMLTDVSGNFPIQGTFHTTVNYITFASFILDGSGTVNTFPTIPSQYWTISNGGVSSQNHDIIIDGLEIRNWFGIGLNLATDSITVRNCHIHHQRGQDSPGFRNYGIYYNGNNGLIEKNEIDHNPGGGTQLYRGGTGSMNLIFRGNSVHDNDSLSTANVGGVLLQGDGAGALTTTNTQFYNNLIFNNSLANTTNPGIGLDISVFTSGTKVWNNTIYGNQGVGLQVGFDSTTLNTTVQNNIIYSNVGGNYQNGGTGTVQDHNLIGVNPVFVNAAASNFHLQAGSPAVNTGITLSAVTTDFDGVVRPQGPAYDIGAYEFSGGDVTPPAPPTGVRILP